MNVSTTESTSHPTYEFTLDNGLKIIVREDHRIPKVYSTLMYGVGAVNERPEDWGLSILLSNVLQDKYWKEVNFLHEPLYDGCFYTSLDYFQLDLPVLREQLDTALKCQAHLMNRIPDDEVIRHQLELLIQKTKGDSAFEEDSGNSAEFEALIETGTTRYRPREGITANLERLTLEQVKQWHKMWYGPNNAVLCVAGDIKVDEVKRLAEKYFGGLARCDLPDRPIVRGPAEPGYRQTTQHINTKYPQMLIIFNTPSLVTTTDHQSVRALQVICELLSKSAPAHLTSVGQNPAYIFASTFRISRGASRLRFAYYFEGDADEAESGFWSLVDALIQSPLSQADIEPAIAAVCTKRQEFNDSLKGQSKTIARLVSNGSPWQLMDLDVPKLKELTPADIQRAAKTFLTRERASVGRSYPAEK